MPSGDPIQTMKTCRADVVDNDPVDDHDSSIAEPTPDGRFVVIKGRRWRATDPLIPDDVGASLRSELMSARRAVGAAMRAEDDEGERRARNRVQAAKVALGERGTPWWEQSEDERRSRWEGGLPLPEG